MTLHQVAILGNVQANLGRDGNFIIYQCLLIRIKEIVAPSAEAANSNKLQCMETIKLIKNFIFIKWTELRGFNQNENFPGK